MKELTMESTAADTPLVTITPAALAQVRRLQTKQGKEGYALRVGVRGGGCSGLSYVMGMEEAPDEDDTVLDFDGLTVLVDPRSARFLRGLTIDYSTANLLEGGWKFTNPNAAKSCGCGTSFTPR